MGRGPYNPTDLPVGGLVEVGEGSITQREEATVRPPFSEGKRSSFRPIAIQACGGIRADYIHHTTTPPVPRGHERKQSNAASRRMGFTEPPQLQSTEAVNTLTLKTEVLKQKFFETRGRFGGLFVTPPQVVGRRKRRCIRQKVCRAAGGEYEPIALPQRLVGCLVPGLHSSVTLSSSTCHFGIPRSLIALSLTRRLIRLLCRVLLLSSLKCRVKPSCCQAVMVTSSLPI